MEVEEEDDYIPMATLTTRMTSALRWAAMRAILMVHSIVRDKVTRQCPQTTTFERDRKAEADSNRGPSAYQPRLELCHNTLTPART